MTVGQGAPPAALRLDEQLLDTRLRVPDAAAGLVSRLEIIDAARTSSCRLVAVTAPPGYGKSTLLAEWARTEDRQVAWVSLNRLDNDPAALLAVLAASFVRATEAHDQVVGHMTGLAALGRAAPRLAAAFNASPRPFVFFLDDLHELRSPACHDVLSVLVSAIPPGSQLVAASRNAQPHLPRLRAGRDALEITNRDLALDPAGAKQIFAEADVDLTRDEAEHLTARTEGWPAGLYLASLMVRDSREPLQVSGDDRYIADYLYGETLSQLEDDTQEFLRRTAVLDQLSGELCDAVLDRQDSQSRLRGLEASSLFVLPVDRRRRWYRYHPLFREFLLGELQRVEPEVVSDLHTRSAAWYEAHGSPALAVEHLLETADRRRCAELVASIALATYQSGQVATVYRWLSELGDGLMEEYPPLAVVQGWLAALTGETTEALRWAAFLDTASFDAKPVDGTASFESARAMLRAAMCADGPEQAMRDARLALDQEEPWSLWHDLALYLYAEAHILVGDTDRGVALLEETAGLAKHSGNADRVVLTSAELAWIAMDRGNWEDAATHLQPGLAAIEEHQLQDYVVSVLAYSAAARLHLHRGNRTEADRLHGRAMRGRGISTHALPFLAVRGRLQLAKVSWASGDQSAARHLLSEMDDILRHRPSLGVLVDDVGAVRATMDAAHLGNGHGPAPLSPAELRLLPYLQTHLTVAEIGERLVVSRNTASSQITSIYRKLGVSTRSDAVREATTVGLLGG